MCKVQMLRSLVKQRLTAAAEEIFGLFERTIAEYEEELSRSKEENERQRKLLDAVLNPQLRLHRADVQQLLVNKEEVPPEQQEWSYSLDLEDPEPPHIKEEQEDFWTSQEGEQLQGLEEADIKFPFTPVPVKSEDDEEKAQSSKLHQRQTEQMETEADGGPEPARNSGPGKHPEPDTDDKMRDSSELETELGDWKETREPQSGLNSLNNDEVPVSDSRCSAGEKPFGYSVGHKSFSQSGSLQLHMTMYTGERPYGCSVCKTSFTRRENLQTHMRIHTGEKPFNCSVCGIGFLRKADVKRHMLTHTGEKPFSCSVCGERFIKRVQLTLHMTQHAGEKPFNCRLCNKRFSWCRHFEKHKCVGYQFSQLLQTEENREAEPPASSSTEHNETEADGEDSGGPEPARNSDPDRHPEPDTDDKTGDSSKLKTEIDVDDWLKTSETQSGLNSPNNNGYNSDEKPFSCSECGKRFGRKSHLEEHMITHTEEKPFSCSLCGKRFRRNRTLQLHIKTHTGENLFSCSVCGKTFIERANMTRHMVVHTGEKRFSCSVCNKTFAWHRQINRHKCVGRQFSQLQGLEEADIKFPFTAVPVKSEDDEEEPQSSKLHQKETEQMETEADGEDCERPEPARNSDPNRPTEPDTDDKTGDSSRVSTIMVNLEK